MVLMPIFMPQSKVGFYIRFLEEKMEITARREVVLQVLGENDNLTLQDITAKTNQDIRTTQAMLTVLKKYGKIESICTKQGKLWRIVR
jgi:Fe2+ or Zn2+ uptake regulation protein